MDATFSRGMFDVATPEVVNSRTKPSGSPSASEMHSSFPGFTIPLERVELTPGRKLGPPQRTPVKSNLNLNSQTPAKSKTTPGFGQARRVLPEDAKPRKSMIKDNQEDVLCNLFNQSLAIRSEQKALPPTKQAGSDENHCPKEGARGSMQMLSPIRPSRAQKESLGCSFQVLTPVRRSARKKAGTKSEQVAVDVLLEATNFSYVSNKALEDSYLEKAAVAAKVAPKEVAPSDDGRKLEF